MRAFTHDMDNGIDSFAELHDRGVDLGTSCLLLGHDYAPLLRKFDADCLGISGLEGGRIRHFEGNNKTVRQPAEDNYLGKQECHVKEHPPQVWTIGKYPKRIDEIHKHVMQHDNYASNRDRYPTTP